MIAFRLQLQLQRSGSPKTVGIKKVFPPRRSEVSGRNESHFIVTPLSFSSQITVHKTLGFTELECKQHDISQIWK